MWNEREPLNPIDELLRGQPMWEPPHGFAQRVAASARPWSDGAANESDWRSWMTALERGALAGVGVYATAVVWEAAAPAVLMNVTAAGWIAAMLSVAWACYASRSLFSRI